MPVFTHGKKTYFSLGTVGSPTVTVDISQYLNEVSFPRSADEVETTTFGAGDYKTYIAGFKDATIDISGRWHPTIDAQLDGILGVDGISFIYGPQGNTTGSVRYSGTVSCLGYDESNSVGDVVGFSSTFRITTAPLRGTF